MPAELTVERVLTVVEQLPPGRVAAYSDIAAIVGTSARRVGTIMARHGSTVPWWRVTNASGELPPSLWARALQRWQDEGIAVRPGRRGCRIADYRADLVALETDYRAAIERTLAAAGLGLPQLPPATLATLRGINVTSLDEAAEHTRAEVAALPEMGAEALLTLDEALEQAGLGWRTR